MSSLTDAPHPWVTILAGGIGSRFWPMSTPARPKQLLPLASERPLIRDTVNRAARLVPLEQVRILTGHGLVAPFQTALPDLPDSAYMVEPRARGTAPVLAWAAWAAARIDPATVIVSLHADHRVDPEDAFTDLLRDTVALAARTGDLLTVGVPPDRAEIGYGYIQPGSEIRTSGDTTARRVVAFHEKPDVERATQYVRDGYLWNTGLFVWRADRFLEEIGRHAPDIAAAFTHLEADDPAAYFDAVPSISVDHAVLERSDRVAVVDATFDWDDVGSWAALERTLPHDTSENVHMGTAHLVDTTGSIAATDGDPVVLWGVEDLVVVRASGVTLVMPRDRAPHLKQLLSELPSDLLTPDP